MGEDFRIGIVDVRPGAELGPTYVSMLSEHGKSHGVQREERQMQRAPLYPEKRQPGNPQHTADDECQGERVRFPARSSIRRLARTQDLDIQISLGNPPPIQLCARRGSTETARASGRKQTSEGGL